MKSKPRPVGRPSKYKPEYCDLLIQHMRDEGLSFESFGGVVDVCRDTLYEWANQHPEFSDAKKRGESHGRLYWEKRGRDGMYNETIKDDDGMTVTRSINSTVWIFTMKNRFGWRDKQEIETRDASKDSLADEVRSAREELKRLRELGKL